MTRRRMIWMLILMALLCGPALSFAGVAPGFPCDRASGVVEKTICADPALSAADAQMSNLYAFVLVSALGHGPSNEWRVQRSALASRQSCSKPSKGDTVLSCLRYFYDMRNSDLAVAAMMRTPDALPVIQRIDPVFAPVAEAIQIWAGEPRNADWSAPERADKRAHIHALLAPYVHYILTADRPSFGRGIMTASGQGWVPVKDIDDILRSEKQFAEFLEILGAYLDDFGSQAVAGNSDSHAGGLSGRRNLSCMAIIRHPALLQATQAVFGSSLDVGVFGNDCRTTLPPVPALERLDRKLVRGWPQCEGTIQFAIIRVYETDIDKALLGYSAQASGPTPERRGVTSSDITAAREGLATYYETYFGKPKVVAGKMAADAVGNILGDAQECG